MFDSDNASKGLRSKMEFVAEFVFIKKSNNKNQTFETLDPQLCCLDQSLLKKSSPWNINSTQ